MSHKWHYVNYQLLTKGDLNCLSSDNEKGFIRAEVTPYDLLMKLGDEQKVKAAGKMGLEGKEYIVQDGDICHYRFNV
jgi:ribosome-binding ATPase YchF (GTP1/OBG family)